MHLRKRYAQTKLDCYLRSEIQQILHVHLPKDITNPYTKIRCSLLSEINVDDSYSYFRCEYREGIEYPKTGLCLSCPLRNLEGIWTGADIDLKEREEYLKSEINRQWLCFGIK